MKVLYDSVDLSNHEFFVHNPKIKKALLQRLLQKPTFGSKAV